MKVADAPMQMKLSVTTAILMLLAILISAVIIMVALQVKIPPVIIMVRY